MPEEPRILVLFGSVVLYGAERGNLEALRALRSRSAELLFLISDAPWNTAVPSVLDSGGLRWRKVPFVHIGKGLSWYNLLWGNPSRFVRANLAFLRAVREFKPTHIHVYAQSHMMNFCLGLIAARAPIVFRAGDEPTLHNWFWRLVWNFSVLRTDRFVANSQFVARSLQENGVSADKIAVIYNRPPTRSPSRGQEVEQQVPANARVLGYVGQIAAHKGPQVLIEAFREVATDFPEAHLALAGRISDWEGDAWARRIRDATGADPSLKGRVTFLGEIEDVAAFLARCDVLVVPSLFDDPSPNVVMEAKQAGKAVIAFPRGGLPELIEHGVDGLLCAEPTKLALEDALRAYLGNPAMAAEHGAAALRSSDRLGAASFEANWYTVYASAHPSRQGR